MTDDEPDLPRPVSYGLRSEDCPEPGIPEWPDDRTGRIEKKNGLAITSLRRKGQWVTAENDDSWLYLSNAL